MFGHLSIHSVKRVAAVLQQQTGNIRQAGKVGFVRVVFAGAVEAGHEILDGSQALDGAGVEVGDRSVKVNEEDGIGVLGQWGVLDHIDGILYVNWKAIPFYRQPKQGWQLYAG